MSVSAPPTAGLSSAVRIGLWMLLSAVSFAALVTIGRYLQGQGLDAFLITFFRNLFAAAMFLPWLLRQDRRSLASAHWVLHLVRSLSLVASTTAVFIGFAMMPLAEATAITFTAPLFTTLLAALILREKVGPRRWGALAIGFAGVVLMLRPGEEAFRLAALILLFAAFTFAIVSVAGKKMAASESPEKITAYLAVLSVPVALIPALPVWQWPSGEQFLWLALLGLVATANMYGFARAFRLGDASQAMPYDFLRLPATALLGWLVFAQSTDLMTWIGAGVIFSATIYISRREAALARAAQAQDAGGDAPPPRR